MATVEKKPRTKLEQSNTEQVHDLSVYHEKRIAVAMKRAMSRELSKITDAEIAQRAVHLVDRNMEYALTRLVDSHFSNSSRYDSDSTATAKMRPIVVQMVMDALNDVNVASLFPKEKITAKIAEYIEGAIESNIKSYATNAARQYVEELADGVIKRASTGGAPSTYRLSPHQSSRFAWANFEIPIRVVTKVKFFKFVTIDTDRTFSPVLTLEDPLVLPYCHMELEAFNGTVAEILTNATEWAPVSIRPGFNAKDEPIRRMSECFDSEKQEIFFLMSVDDRTFIAKEVKGNIPK